jgi:hypothetical protein
MMIKYDKAKYNTDKYETAMILLEQATFDFNNATDENMDSAILFLTAAERLVHEARQAIKKEAVKASNFGNLSINIITAVAPKVKSKKAS